jgi:hypothetical protein
MMSKLLRPTSALASLALIGGPIAGCGGSGSASAVGTTAAPSVPVTKAQAMAWAHAVNLQAADLPGMTVTSREGPSPASTGVGREINRCAGLVNPGVSVVGIRSAKFAGVAETEHEQINSAVEVMSSAAVAARNNAVAQSQRALSCAERLLPRLYAKQNGGRVRYGALKVSRLSDPLPGAPGSFGIRVAISILGVPGSAEPTQPHLYVDGFGFLSGSGEVNLIATAFPEPVSEEVEQRLLSLLSSRAQAHRLP